MKISKEFFKNHAHSSYIDGLDQTGISLDQIPSILDMDKKLNKIGWRAVPVRGFLPPPIFMEFQAHCILPIASDMRDVSHMTYTPAPDIVHEAAGHSPIIVDPDYSNYLKKYGEIASKVIYSNQDHEIYMAIRFLSDLKENPNADSNVIKDAEDNLKIAINNNEDLSESAYLSRLNWWTVEYGLVGDMKMPKIYGAGLLSSVGESYNAIYGTTKKIPLTIDCLNFSYDITEQQPQLFVARDFNHLSEVLDEFSKTTSYFLGGKESIIKAINSKSICTFQLDTGLQISGIPVKVLGSEIETYYRFEGPVQLSYKNKQIDGHGGDYHSEGFSSPLCDSDSIKILNESTIGQTITINFKDDINLKGTIKDKYYCDGKLLLVSFSNCNIVNAASKLFDSNWGVFDLACGFSVDSVFGGAADIESFIPHMNIDFPNKQRPKYLSDSSIEKSSLISLYEQFHNFDENIDSVVIKAFFEDLESSFTKEWLLLFFILEKTKLIGDMDLYSKIKSKLLNKTNHDKDLFNSIKRGIHLLDKE